MTKRKERRRMKGEATTTTTEAGVNERRFYYKIYIFIPQRKKDRKKGFGRKTKERERWRRM